MNQNDSHFCIFSKAGDPTDDICCFPYNSIMWCNLVSYFSFSHFSLQPFSLFLRRQAILLPFCTIAFLALDRVTFGKSKLFENVGETIIMTILLPRIVFVEESKIQIHNVKMLFNNICDPTFLRVMPIQLIFLLNQF